MIYPKSNEYRSVLNLNGIWHFKTLNESYDPCIPLQNYTPMAVPASMNELVTDANVQKHVGKVVYETDFSIPLNGDMEYRLRIGATSHKCDVYLNGVFIGEGTNGFLPIDLALKNIQKTNRLSVVIDNRLDAETFPAGRIKNGKQIINFDFYNFTGIHRDVLVYSVPKKNIKDITIHTAVDGDYRKIKIDVDTSCDDVRFEILDKQKNLILESESSEIIIDDPHLWSTRDPYLYTLVVKSECDRYEERFGIRKIEVKGDKLLLNDEPIYLKGFGMHEDFFLLGKGNCCAVNIRNFELLKWINANSFRTSHYPYSEEIMDLADEYGMLVIDEVPAVGMIHWEQNFGEKGANEKTLKLHKELISQLYDRDKNHPSVIMISVANEAETKEAESEAYFKDVIEYTKSVWDRPVTIVELYKSDETLASKYADVISINRYFGWYFDHGDLSVVYEQMKEELQKWHDKYQKPIIVTEFGADTIEGLHAIPAESFSEEFQLEYIKENCNAFDEFDFCIGEHVWNFADFKTKQGITRVRGNRKGVFTKDRQPKLSAHFLRQRWGNILDK
ncbi:MAG: beta-glucuronidase [Clostridia bacterium]|nr:beta-glucuronidase [Clostridia bacterium]